MKSISRVRIIPFVLLFIGLVIASPGMSQTCLAYDQYMHYTFHSPASATEYAKFSRQIIHQSDWVYTVIHVDTGDVGSPVADEVIAVNVSSGEASLPASVLAPSDKGFYCFDVREDGTAFFSTFQTNPPPDSHYLMSYDMSNAASWSYLDSAYQFLFDPFRYFDAGMTAAYVADQSPRLFVFNIADPGDIVQDSYFTLPQVPRKVLLSDNEGYLFILGDTRFYIYSLQAWWNPQLVASMYLGSSATDMIQVGSYLLIAGVDKVTRFDISDPTAPFFEWIVYLDEVEDVTSIAVAGSNLYAAGPSGPVEIQDISDYHNAQYRASVPLLPSQLNDPALDAQGTEFYAAFGDRGYFGYDVSDFREAQPASSVPMGRTMAAMDVGGRSWFVTVGYGRFRVVDVQNPLAPAEIGYTPFNYTQPTDVWCDISNAYVTTQNGEFVSYSVVDRENPELIGSCTVGPCLGLDVYGSYAFVAAGPLGLKVVGVRDPANPSVVATVPGYYEETTSVAIVSAGTSVAYALQSNSPASGGECGLAVVDIGTPWSPQVFDIVSVPRSSRAFQIDDYVVLYGEGNLTFVDVSSSFYPEVESVIGLPGTGDGITYVDGHFYIADGERGMQVVEWSPGFMPRLVGNLPMEQSAMDVAALGDYVYLATEPAGISVAYRNCAGASPVPDHDVVTADVLSQNEPNPFNPLTMIVYELVEPVPVNLEVFDLTGRRIAVLRDGTVEMAGRHAVEWTGRDHLGQLVPSGVYCYRLRAGAHSETRKMVLIR